jgi:uncharacterized protein (DUF362 family)
MKAKIFDFSSYEETIPLILKAMGLKELIAHQKQILIKPNLTTNLPPPVTTSVKLVEEVIKFCQANSQATLIIAEGSGGCDTNKAFVDLGFERFKEQYPIKLLDLNKEPRVRKENPEAKVLKKVFLPKIAFESFIINLAVLKSHSAAKMTAALKNVFGFYLNRTAMLNRLFGGGWWNKSELHILGVTEAIVDLNSYIHFGFNLVDASIGQLRHEIRGVPCSPPLKKIIAGSNAYEVDQACAPLLGLSPSEITYLSSRL